MNSEYRRALRERRLALQNPYAFIEQLEDARSDVSEEVSEARRLLQNQFAYLNDDGSFGGLSSAKTRAKKSREQHIAEVVRSLHEGLWSHYSGRLKSSIDKNVSIIDFIDLDRAASQISIEIERVPDLGVYDEGLRTISTAGIFDRPAGKISICTSFPAEVQRFTAAHEIGHALLHPQMNVAHRDRALEGARLKRDTIEFEADYFAVLFLMPEKSVRKEFESRFLTQEFHLNDDTAYALGIKLGEYYSRERISRHLASAIRYNGRYFYSLTQVFGLSVEAVALRLEELGLC